MKQRRGISLVEVMITLTIGSVVMGVAAMTLGTLFRNERVARDQLSQGVQLARLAEQFRRDVHAATAVAAEGDDENATSQWKLDLPSGGTVTYRAVYRETDGELLRTETTSEQGAVARRDAFALPANTTAAIEVLEHDVQEDRAATLVRLVISPADVDPNIAGRSSPKRPIDIDAVLAKDHRFAVPKSAAEEKSAEETAAAEKDAEKATKKPSDEEDGGRE